MTRAKASRRHFFSEHSLSFIVGGILLLWLVLYLRADPSTHIGAFFGNAIADWLGMFTFVIVTKYCYEIGSKESRQPHSHVHIRIARFMVEHSLTIVLVVTGVLWAWLYARLDVDGKAGQVVGNVVSEWTQLIGLVVITKYAREVGSKEGG
jgi:hypothetical protein